MLVVWESWGPNETATKQVFSNDQGAMPSTDGGTLIVDFVEDGKRRRKRWGPGFWITCEEVPNADR